MPAMLHERILRSPADAPTLGNSFHCPLAICKHHVSIRTESDGVPAWQVYLDFGMTGTVQPHIRQYAPPPLACCIIANSPTCVQPSHKSSHHHAFTGPRTRSGIGPKLAQGFIAS